jgi:hypothetical protein
MRRGRLVGLGAALVATLVALELGCFVLARVRGEHFTWHDATLYVLRPEELTDALARNFHPVLGWKTPHETPFGERPRPVDYPQAFLASFGDSYTYCVGVEDGETWQSRLAARISADVYNFGNGAYGTDQAFLRFREDFPALRTPVVVLGMITENINRIHNRYRKFYFARTRTPLTKPRFLLVDGELELLPNPVRDASELERLCDPDFIDEIGQDDVWFDADSFPERSFPYSRCLFYRSFWRELRQGPRSKGVDDADPRPNAELWADDQARELLFAILRRFAEEARAEGSHPVLMLFPMFRETSTRMERGVPSDFVRALAESCEESGLDFFDGISAFATAVSDERELRALYGNHLSPRGNDLLAELFQRWLEERGLLSAPR